jgi:hypothetical protein
VANKRTATVTVEEPCVLFFVNKAKFKIFLSIVPEMRQVLFDRICKLKGTSRQGHGFQHHAANKQQEQLKSEISMNMPDESLRVMVPVNGD